MRTCAILLTVALVVGMGCRSMPAVGKARLPAPLVIERMEYRPASRTLILQDSDGALYNYQHVPQRVYDRLLAAPAKTDYYLRHIRGRYQVVKIRSGGG